MSEPYAGTGLVHDKTNAGRFSDPRGTQRPGRGPRHACYPQRRPHGACLRLISIRSAHVDSCLYHGPSSLDFVHALLDGGGSVSVPTTLNVGVDREQPEVFLGKREEAAAARELMDYYVRLGCQPTFTCAPYQLFARPALYPRRLGGVQRNCVRQQCDRTENEPLWRLYRHLRGNHRPSAVFGVPRYSQSGRKGSVHDRPGRLIIDRRRSSTGATRSSYRPCFWRYGTRRVGLTDAGIGEDWCPSFGSAAASSGSVRYVSHCWCYSRSP